MAKKIYVDIVFGPPGGYGFRKGYWPVQRDDGVWLKVFCSVPHSAKLDHQERLVRAAAEEAFALYDAGKPGLYRIV